MVLSRSTVDAGRQARLAGVEREDRSDGALAAPGMAGGHGALREVAAAGAQPGGGGDDDVVVRGQNRVVLVHYDISSIQQRIPLRLVGASGDGDQTVVLDLAGEMHGSARGAGSELEHRRIAGGAFLVAGQGHVGSGFGQAGEGAFSGADEKVIASGQHRVAIAG